MMKGFWKAYQEFAEAKSEFIGEFYLDIARTLGPLGKLFLHALAGGTIVATTGINFVTIAHYHIFPSIEDHAGFVLFTIILDLAVYIKVWGLFKALEKMKNKA
jgi:hypothetical protein